MRGGGDTRVHIRCVQRTTGKQGDDETPQETGSSCMLVLYVWSPELWGNWSSVTLSPKSRVSDTLEYLRYGLNRIWLCCKMPARQAFFLCSPNWPWVHGDPPASAFRVWGDHRHGITMPSLTLRNSEVILSPSRI